MPNDKTVQEQSFLVQSYIDRAIGAGEESDKRTSQAEMYTTSRKYAGVFKKKKRKMSKVSDHISTQIPSPTLVIISSIHSNAKHSVHAVYTFAEYNSSLLDSHLKAIVPSSS